MKFNGKKVLSLALAGVMLSSTITGAIPARAASAAPVSVQAYQPIQLEAAHTKIMDYYAADAIPANIAWVTNSAALTFMPAAAIGDVTCAVKASDGAIWVGTENGLMRMDFTERDPRDITQYFAGNRYLYNGDDHVTALAADDDCGVWVKNAAGAVHIKMPKMTMEDRTYFYEKLITDVNDRRGMITDSNSYAYDPVTDEYTQTFAGTNDNDGLWTAMYAIGEILRYQTLKREDAPAAEIAAAKAAATRATKAVLLLEYVSGRGNGFPCRSYMLTSEAGATVTKGIQQEDGFWFEKRLLDEGEAYPQPIIDELKLDGKTPIGIATVRVTRDAMQKRGSRIFPNDTDFNGLGLSQSSISTFNATQADGSKLGTDIVSGEAQGNQVFPVMVEGVNIKKNWSDDWWRSADREVKNEDIKFRLTAPVYERIPQLFNDLFPDSAIGADGYIDESQIVYKADTSSDEVDGHYALLLTAYDLLCDEPADEPLKDMIAQSTVRMTDLILMDDNYYIVDATGKSTQWSRWLSRYFNDSLDIMKAQPGWDEFRIGVDAEGEDLLSYGYEDASLNALEVMSALKIAGHIATEESMTDKAAIYNAAYAQCYESDYSGGGAENKDPYVNGKGYIQMALEYIERRIVRQATDAYDENDGKPVTEYIPGNRIFNNALHQDWTQYVNYSDEELGWFPVYTLLALEEDPTRKAQIVASYDQWFEGQEEREENPFYTFLYQFAHPEKTDVDLQSAVRYFYRSPLLRNNRIFARGDRQDVLYIESGNRDGGKAQTNYALPLDEMRIGKDNGNPFARYSGYGESAGTPYTAGSLDCSTVFTLPYWFGRYYGMIEETSSDYYTRVTPSAILSTTPAAAAVTVTDNGTALERMIVDFYEDGAYIGRVRTDETGKAVLNKATTGVITATVTERLIDMTMYNQTDATRALPTEIKLSLPEDMEMVVGENHSIDFIILPEENQLRGVSWTSSNPAVATVDGYGRVTAVAAGDTTITATAKANPAVSASGSIQVVATLGALSKATPKEIVNYTAGAPAAEVENLQKYVDRYTKAEAAEDAAVPQTVKDALGEGSKSTANVVDGTATWSLESYGVKRVDTSPVHPRDAEQFFMGNRYLPDGTILHLEKDEANGLWVVSDAADGTAVTHIRMETLSYTDKAAEMSQTTQENVSRRGMVSQARLKDGNWVGQESDNDGLWTGMYGAGELMRYSVLKEDPTATPAEIAAARETALKSIKAVLLLSNITCRTGEIDAYIRPLKNESNQYLYDTKYEGYALLKGKDFSINNPQTGPVGKTARVDGADLMAPFVPSDWASVTATSNKSDFETRTRTLEGMIARTYSFAEEEVNYNDGYFWDITGNTATCLPTTSEKVKWEKLAGTTVDASGEIPNVLIDLLEGKGKDDIIYKTDTSTDEIIGHLFIYKIAYDVLDVNDPEESAIRDLLVTTVRNFAKHMADNGYSLRDATGQATTWGKTERDYFNNAYAWEDCALNSLVNLCGFKLAAYVTGEQRWEDEYQMLAKDAPYDYATLAGEYWDRWAHLAVVDGGLSETAPQAEIDAWIRDHLNYSDEEMAMLAYYLLFQMEEDEGLLADYQAGLDAWWNESMAYSENPLWYYIYQLSKPGEAVTDQFGNKLVDTAAWALSRHPIDTITWFAHNENRPDAVREGEVSYDKTSGAIRVVPQDERNLHKFNGPTYELDGGDANNMEGSTTYTLPYWLGRYHGMIAPAAD